MHDEAEGPTTAKPESFARRYLMVPRLVEKFGVRYVLMIVATYGLSQGAGEGWAGYASQYLFTDDVERGGFALSPNTVSEIDGFDNVPWQIKAIYGVVSDVYPLGGLHRTPYMLISSLVGVVSWILLALPSSSYIFAALLLFWGNFSIASPDVMLDASVAEKCREHPEYGSDLQSLCWGSFGVFKILSLLVAPGVYETYGARALFGITSLTSVAVLIPSWLGWLGEVPGYTPILSSSSSGSLAAIPSSPAIAPPAMTRTTTTTTTPTHRSTTSSLASELEHPVNGRVIRLSFLLTLVSTSMGLVALFAREHYLVVSLTSTFVVVPLVLWLIWKYQSRVNKVMAKALCLIFLFGVVQPSSSILFYWMKHDEFNCGARATTNVTIDDPPQPCFKPDFIANLSIVGYVFFTFGVVIYNRYLSKWSYVSIYTFTQIGLCALNLLDLFWVLRLNLKIGLSDEAFVLGDEVVGPVMGRLNTMPLFLLATQICPPGVEATFFAMTMGLSNFGATLGEYTGMLLMLMTDVDRHKYANLPLFVFLKSLSKLIPLLFLCFLIPDGSPGEGLRNKMEFEVGVEMEETSRQELEGSTSKRGVVEKQERDVEEEGESARLI